MCTEKRDELNLWDLHMNDDLDKIEVNIYILQLLVIF